MEEAIKKVPVIGYAVVAIGGGREIVTYPLSNSYEHTRRASIGMTDKIIEIIPAKNQEFEVVYALRQDGETDERYYTLGYNMIDDDIEAAMDYVKRTIKFGQ